MWLVYNPTHTHCKYYVLWETSLNADVCFLMFIFSFGFMDHLPSVLSNYYAVYKTCVTS
jgi:hypothetical protein